MHLPLIVRFAGSLNCSYLPDAGDFSQVHIPALLVTLGLDDVETLSIAGYLGSIESLLHNIYKLLLALVLHESSKPTLIHKPYSFHGKDRLCQQ